MKKKLRFLLPHEPLKVLRGEPDEEDEQDELFRRFQPPPGTTTEEEQDDDNTDIDDDEDDLTTDAAYVSDDDGMDRHHATNNISINGRSITEQNLYGSDTTEALVHLPSNDDIALNDDEVLLSNETTALLPSVQGTIQ